MEKNNDLFWGSSIDELKKGYKENSSTISCIICGEEFVKGEIYQLNNKLYDAQKAAEIHIKEEHTSTFNYMLNMNSIFTGISEAQKDVITLMTKGIPDKDIAKILKVSPSTIRNHRYKLREKEKQARVFLALMELLSEDTNKEITLMENSKLCEVPKTATAVDDRFNISDTEKEKILKSYIDETGALKTYPTRQKRKIVVLEEISKNFSLDKKYTEKEVNRILKRIHEDYMTLRRALIEYGFLERTNDGSAYWVKI